MKTAKGVKYACITFIVAMLIAASFAADAMHLAEGDRKGWGLTAFIALALAGGWML